jgi:cardiolipin synthase (CMP-forming)
VEDVRAPEEESSSRVLTVPNVITVLRLACLPVFLWLLFGEDNRHAAAWLLGGLGATDFLDGYIARHFHQVSDIGKILDPVADRLLFFVGIVAIMIDGSAPLWFCVLVLAREALISVATVALAALGARRIDVTWFGKAGALLLMFAFPFFLVSESGVFWADVGHVLGYVTGLPGLALSYYSGFLYVPLSREALREGRAARTAKAATT